MSEFKIVVDGANISRSDFYEQKTSSKAPDKALDDNPAVVSNIRSSAEKKEELDSAGAKDVVAKTARLIKMNVVNAINAQGLNLSDAVLNIIDDKK